MPKKICCILVVLLAAVCSASVYGQTKASFVSQDGGFTIALPMDGLQDVDSVGDVGGGGGTYAWATDDGQFSVSYLDNAFAAQDVKRSLNSLADLILKGPVNRTAAVISRRQFEVDGNTIIEIRLRRPGGLAINRLISVKRRLYVITADWIEGDGKAATDIINSFTLVDGTALIA